MVLISLLAGKAQTPAEMQKAFQESYTLEAGRQYAEAAEALMAVALENGYEVNLRLGWLNYKAGNYTGALEYYQKCIQMRPLSLEARFGYVLPAGELGHWDQVLAKYKEILGIDVYNTKANYYAGLIYYNRADYAAAEKYFQKVVNLYPFDYDSLLMLAWTKYFLGKSSEAKALFNKVLLYSPGDESAMEGLGLIK
jgi:tetratricopeptide (TPR) repeat protein